jgi:hypothetical protein
MRFLLALLLFLPALAFAAPNPTYYTDSHAQTTVVLASGGTTSAEIDLGGTMLVGLQMPSTFTGTSVTFTVANASGGTFQTMKDGAGNSVSKTVAASQYIAIDPTLFRGVRFCKIVSGSTEGADRTITVYSVPVK